MSLLSKVTSGVVRRPHYLLMHGIPGIGKSTFAGEAPSPIFLCAEQGTNHLNVSRLEMQTYKEFLAAIIELKTADHQYKSMVIDTVDHLEALIFRQVCEDKKKSSIEEIGYAKGYIFALDYWRELIKAWEDLREAKGMNIILLAHTEVKPFNDPQLAEAYDRYQVKLHPKASGLLVDRVDEVLFVNYDTVLHSKEGERNKAFGDGSRVIFTETRPSHIAKNRHNLPYRMALSWSDFATNVENQQAKPPEEILKNIKSMLAELSDVSMKEKIEKHVETVKASALELSKVENRLKTIVSAA